MNYPVKRFYAKLFHILHMCRYIEYQDLTIRTSNYFIKTLYYH